MSRILFFDEEVSQSKKIKELLELEKHEVIMTRRISETRKILEGGDISLLVINIEKFREDEDFDQALLKKYHDNKAIPVIFIISDPESQFSPLRYEFEIEDVILKPYRVEEMVLRIINQLKKVRNVEIVGDELEKLSILYQVGNLPHDSMKLDIIAYRILEIISNTFNCESGAIFLKSEDDQISLYSKIGVVENEDLEKSMHFITKNTVNLKKMVIHESLPDEFFWHRIRPIKPESLQNAICIPLKVKDKVIGTIELYNATKSLLSEGDNLDLKFLQQVVAEAEKVINLLFQFLRVNKDLKFAIDELSILYEISNALSSTLNLEELLKLIVRNALNSFDAQVVSLMLLDKENEELSIHFAEGLNEDIIKDTKVRLGDGIAGRVAKTGQPLLLVDMMGIDTVDIDKNTKSAMSVPLKIKNEVIGVLNVSKTSQYRFTETDLKLLFNLASLAAQAIERASLYKDIKDSLDEIKSSYMSTVKALSKAIEAKDPYTKGHVDRVAKYGLAIAMELEPALLKNDMFRYALVLHDIGKIEIPDHILTKPGGLTNEERAIIRRHPEVGAQILSPVKFLKGAADMVKHHQERYDGKGYPKGLEKEEIPLAARIIAVADSFDAIISNRPYRQARTVLTAKEEIIKNAGTQFDPTVVSAFLSALDKKVIP
ncbi:MAG: GAF domain-containing protein [Candidatus Eremiobacteraeota bacterium]|nr:GAF domain-containing protein [Candidatus Eremiobacteraeota bacterium]